MSAVVLLSGGQDSATCLFWALRELGRPVHTVCFDYGQRHRAELEAARRIAELAAVDSHLLIRVSAIGAGALTSATSDVMGLRPDGLPAAFLPGRNVVFLTLAAAHASALDVRDVVIGACENDAAGFPDCRVPALLAAERALSLALPHSVTVRAPLAALSKAATVKMARSLGDDCWRALGASWSCYNPGRRARRRPCARCLACTSRAAGFAAAGERDPALGES